MPKKRKNKAPPCDFTFEQSLACATKLLTGLGIENARLDAELLLQHVVKKSRLALHLARGDHLSSRSFRAFMRLVARRLCHEPLAYIVGHKEFYGYDFKLSRACLIPRPDTEIIVEECLKRIDTASHDTIIDLCTGSGAIALSILAERPSLKAIATDISKGALAMASNNAERLHVLDRLTLKHGDLFAAIDTRIKAHLIVANPPYIATKVINTLAKTVREYEPRRALDGHDDGLWFYRRIFADAPLFLEPEGYLIMEIGFDQAGDISDMVSHPFELVSVVRDLGGCDRCMVVRLTRGL